MDASLMPALPSDLERLIFEVAALLWALSIPKFMVEPILYRTIIVFDDGNDRTNPLAIETSALLSLIRTKPPSFFRNSVRQLHFDTRRLNKTDEADILSACSNIENLYLAAQSWQSTVSAMDMPLKRLHCTLHALFDTGAIDFTHRIFASITHLEIHTNAWMSQKRIDPEEWSGLASVPHLTHLAFVDDNWLPVSHCAMWLTLLQKRASPLRVLAVQMSKLIKASELGEDPRFVVMPWQDYRVMGAYTGEDYWSRAENFVWKRTLGEIRPLEYYLELENIIGIDWSLATL
ncbi:hypothetical protein DFH06DRAFT_1321099 [Mycena polygramma]|nr:hypothetical protein DFH06DRAFT_1321099 [Mycena polygramma]